LKGDITSGKKPNKRETMASGDRLNEKLKQRDFKLNALLELTRAINDDASVEELLGLYERFLKEELFIEKLVLFTRTTTWRCILKYGVQQNEVHDISDEAFFTKQREIGLTTELNRESFDLTVPITQHNETIAYLLVGDQGEQEIKMSPVIKHMRFIQTITSVLVVAIQNKQMQSERVRQELIKRELELAAEMQAILLPHHLPNNSSFDVSAIYRAHQQVGGDYYDFMELNENQIMFCMADVSGKGVSAAFLMANFQAYLRSIFTYRHGDLVEIVRELNDCVMRTALGEKYITLFLGVFSKNTRMLNYINCGHNPPVLVDRNGYTQQLKQGTIGLGMFEALPKVVEGEVKLDADTIVMCFTDGLVETENQMDEEFGTERLEKLLLHYFKEPMYSINEIVIQSLDEFRGETPYRDDLAVLSCRFK
jgi:phosphoserine phosphatase RsbU/P